MTPTSTGESAPASEVLGVAVALKMLVPDGLFCPCTVTVMPAAGVSRLPLSSTARLLMVTVPVPAGRPGIAPALTVGRRVAGCQVVPPSAETSTPPTTPPPESVAVPVIVTGPALHGRAGGR